MPPWNKSSNRSANWSTSSRAPEFSAKTIIENRELVLVRVKVNSKSRPEVMQITDIFRAKIVDVQSESLTVEVTGDEGKVEKLIELLKPFTILDLTRTGKVALPRK